MTHTHHHTAFRWFLALYTAVLIYHMFEVPWQPILFVGFVAGLSFAIFSHLRSGLLTIALLLVHMAIEWSEYAANGGGYQLGEIVFLALHALLDIAFLWQEVRAHLYRYRRTIFTFVSLGIVCAIAIAHTGVISLGKIPDGYASILEPIVLGGILGCTLSHIGLFKRI